jgi:CelD/BcsL family acetyltransferase involved in cellulose biosynthesis
VSVLSRNGPPSLGFSTTEESGGFQSLQQPWNALWTRLDRPHLFSSFEWCWNAWRLVAEGRGYKLRLVCGWLEERLVLIWPMMEDGGVLRMLSSETLEYRDIIVEPSEHAARWIDDAWSHVLATTHASTFLFQNLRLPNALGTKLAKVTSARRIGGGWCPLVGLDRFADWDAYARTLPKSLISDQRRQWKRLRQALPGVSFRLIDNARMIEPVMDWISRHKLRWGQERGNPTVWFSSEDIHALLKSVAERTLEDGRLVLATLSAGDKTISAGWGYICGGEFLFHAFAYDLAYATYSPSRLFLENLLQYCISNGIRTLDFMPGEEAYKRIWATDYVGTESYIGPLNWRGMLLLRLARLKSSAPSVVLRRLYRKLPGRWRETMQRRLRTYRLVNQALALKPTPKPQATSSEARA